MATPPQSVESVGVAIFAKAPIEGFAKTRLIPRLGAKGAANLQRRLLERAVRIACAAKVGPVSLWCSPDLEHDSFRDLADSHSLTLHRQDGDDLGQRMDHAFSVMTAERPLLLMGTDCVVIEPWHLVDCANALRAEADAVFIPVEDGGYILIGLKAGTPALFASMPWGSREVMEETRKRASTLGLRLFETEPLWDIDLPEDYDRALVQELLPDLPGERRRPSRIGAKTGI